MTEEIMALCRAMGATEDQEGLLLPLAQASAQALERRLKPGTSPGLCGPAFPLAAAMLAMDGLERAVGSGRVSSFTAGELSIRMGGTAGEGGLTATAERLLAPWLGETGFAFRCNGNISGKRPNGCGIRRMKIDLFESR